VTSEEVSIHAYSCLSPVQQYVCPVGQSNLCWDSMLRRFWKEPLGVGAGVSSAGGGASSAAADGSIPNTSILV